MSVFRVNKNKNYIVMSKNHFKEREMSLKAKGLLSEMLSLPDDWDYSISGLVALNKENETSIKSALDELKEFGYLEMTKLLPNETKSGRIEYIYDIYEEKQEGEKQGVENLGVEFLGVENQGQYNNKELNNKDRIINNNIYDFLQENGFQLAPIHYEVVSEWKDNELTRYAIKKAVLNNKYNISYIDKILYNWKKNNITTIQQAIQQDEDYKKRNDNYNNKQTKKDVPDWYDKDIKTNASQEDVNEMKKILEELGE